MFFFPIIEKKKRWNCLILPCQPLTMQINVEKKKDVYSLKCVGVQALVEELFIFIKKKKRTQFALFSFLTTPVSSPLFYPSEFFVVIVVFLHPATRQKHKWRKMYLWIHRFWWDFRLQIVRSKSGPVLLWIWGQKSHFATSVWSLTQHRGILVPITHFKALGGLQNGKFLKLC